MSQILTLRQAEELYVAPTHRTFRIAVWQGIRAARLRNIWKKGLTCPNRHKSIIAYLTSINIPANIVADLKEQLEIGEGFDTATSKKYEGLLEKKWTSVVRLQKKVGLYYATRRAPEER